MGEHRSLIAKRIRENNLISGAYKHVDGTSFAAPIVSSIAALMIEANPALAPQEIKRLLIDTARRIPGISVDRQGWGVVDAEKAVQAARDARGRPSPLGAGRARPRPA